jgi:YbbR domain-containing protein
MEDRATARTRRVRRWHLDLRRSLVHDLPLKVAALAIALLLWVAAAEAAPRETVEWFPGRVPVERPEIPAGYVLRGQLGDVRVLLRAPEAIFGKIAQQDLRATIDITDLDAAREEPQDATIHVTASDPRVAVVQVDPATVAVRLERLVTRTLAVQVRFANPPPPGFQPGVPALSAAEVGVTGPQSLVGSVAAVYVTLRYGDTPVDLSQSAQAVAVDAAGAVVDGVRVEPAAVQVTIPVLSTASTRTLPLLWTISGSVANGYWIQRITTDPVAVTVRGDQGLLAPLQRIETASIDVNGLTANRSYRVALLLPAGVTLIEPTDAVVGVTVVPLTGTRPFPLVAVTVTGLGANLIAELDPRTVDTVVAGPVPTLAALAADAVSASVDASGKGPGTYAADVTVRVPAGLTLQSVQPTRVTLTIRSK